MSNDKKFDYNKIQVHNRTLLEIPSDVIDILSLGKKRGIGSDTDLSPKVFSELKKLFESFQKQARINNIPETVTAGIKAYTILNGNNINNSEISDPRFLKENDDVILLTIVKQADLILLTKSDNHEKLENLLI